MPNTLDAWMQFLVSDAIRHVLLAILIILIGYVIIAATREIIDHLVDRRADDRISSMSVRSFRKAKADLTRD
jgi:hypothetical protein